MIGRARLYYDELLTVLIEIEGILNSRPLTFLSAEDMDKPLTPSHFLCGRRILTLPHGLTEATSTDLEEYSPSPSDLTRRLKYLNATLNQFLAKWKQEYLLELREAHRYHEGRSDAVSPSVGDIVLVEDDDKPRALWKLAKVTDLITGRDGHTRGAILHVPSGGHGVLQRPLQRLYPLEVTTQQGTSVETTDNGQAPQRTTAKNATTGQAPQRTTAKNDTTRHESEPTPPRPRRSAAVKA